MERNLKFRAMSLIELIIVIVIVGILSVGIAAFMGLPIRAYSKMVVRSELVDFAELAIRRIAYDIQQAVPNSVRVKTSGNQSAIEFLNAVSGYRYRINPSGTSALDTTGADAEWHVFGQFSSAILSGGPYRVVVNNTGDEVGSDSDQPVAGRNVYGAAVSPNVITPASGTTVTLSNVSATEGQIVLNPAFHFSGDSPKRRLYLVDTPVSYICDLDSGQQTLTRYWNYTISSTQPMTSDLGSANSALVTQNITGCSFEYLAGSEERFGSVTIRLTVQDSNSQEKIQLLQQVSLLNVS